MAVIDAVEDIKTALHRNKYTSEIEKKAFETLNHYIPPNKLEAHRIRGVVLSRDQIYKTGRKQIFKMEEFTSDPKEISCGVPHRSILGPLQFNICINDTFNVLKLLKLIMFAAETNIFSSTDSSKDINSIK